MSVLNNVEFSKLFYRISKLEQTTDGVLITLENLNIGTIGSSLHEIKGYTVFKDDRTSDDPPSEYAGISLQHAGDSSISQTISYIDFRNNLGGIDSSIFATHKDDGSSEISFQTSPAGTFEDPTRTTALLIDGDGNIDIGADLYAGGLTVLNSLTVQAPNSSFIECEMQTLGVTGDSNLNNLYVANNTTLGDSSLSLAAVTGTLRVNGPLTASSDLQVNGGDITSTSTTFNLLNSTVSTINIGGASSTVNIGNTGDTGYTNIKGNFAVTGNIFLGNTQGDVVTFNAGNISLNNNLSFDSNTLYIDRVNNRIGIGTSSPGYPLHVYGSVAYGSSATYGYLSAAGIDSRIDAVINVASDSTAPFGIKAEQRIAAAEFNAISDIRNKHIYQAPEENLLQRFKKISIIDFKHKEYSSFELDRGVIAQELEEIFPDAVKKTKDYVSDIFGPPKEKINLSDKEYKLILNEKHSAKIGDKIKIAFKDEEIKETICEIILVEDEYSITIKSEEKISDNCSIMGRLVDNYRLVNYQYLFSTTIKVVQSLLERIETLENKISSSV